MYRLIISGAKEGSYNMAVDTAIFSYFKKGFVPPTIRFFWFEPPCVSIGRIQKIKGLMNAKYYLVRRPTGGRAVIHKGDLSFSIICRTDDPLFGGDILQTYMRSSSMLVDTLREMGIEAGMVKAKTGDIRSPLCLQSTSRYELVSGGRKVMGNAQWREGDFILLQGSMDIADRESLIEKYKSVLRRRGIEFEEGNLTDEESSLALSDAPEFRI